MTNVVPLRPRGESTEPYVTRAEMAQMAGVSVKTIDRLVRDGMPSETFGLAIRRFQPSVALRWMRTQKEAR